MSNTTLIQCSWCGELKLLGDYQAQRVGGKIARYGKQCKPCLAFIRRERRAGRLPHTKKTETGLGFFKHCGECYLWKPTTSFYKHNKSGLQGVCCDCVKAGRKVYYQDNRDVILQKEAEQRWSLRLEAIVAYGGKCECCGESNPEFLTIDHVNGGGTKHRKELGGTKKFYKFIRQAGYPREGYRLLCYNCNCARGALGYCPHERQRVIIST